MKPCMSQQDLDDIVSRSSQLTRNTRALFGLEPPNDDSPSTPFDWMAAGIVRVIEIFVVAVLAVVMLAAACAGGPTP